MFKKKPNLPQKVLCSAVLIYQIIINIIIIVVCNFKYLTDIYFCYTQGNS
jgi:hypothetical protein